jgi:hypothetical protein
MDWSILTGIVVTASQWELLKWEFRPYMITCNMTISRHMHNSNIESSLEMWVTTVPSYITFRTLDISTEIYHYNSTRDVNPRSRARDHQAHRPLLKVVNCSCCTAAIRTSFILLPFPNLTSGLPLGNSRAVRLAYQPAVLFSQNKPATSN